MICSKSLVTTLIWTFSAFFAFASADTAAAQQDSSLLKKLKAETYAPGCFWSDNQKKVICITLPKNFPKLTGGGGCGGSSDCGGNNEEREIILTPEMEAKILKIDPGTLTKPGTMKALNGVTILKGN